MLSGALAGLLKVGAVALTAGGLATGIYLAVQVGEEEDANRAQTVETPSTISTALSPPNQVVRPTITPTYVLAPSPTPPTGVDTSDWKTYESPLGFTLKYPPGWAIKDYQSEGLAPGTVKILNEAATRGFAARLGAGELEGAESGEAWLDISPDAFPTFDAAGIIHACAPERVLEDPREVSLGGQPAVHCVQEGASPFAPETTLRTDTYWVRLPSGRVAGISAYTVDGDAATIQIVGAAAATFWVQAKP
ncbi:MAG: hypothetical protein WEE64_11525 [Dehalococcoidia bacterium]